MLSSCTAMTRSFTPTLNSYITPGPATQMHLNGWRTRPVTSHQEPPLLIHGSSWVEITKTHCHQRHLHRQEVHSVPARHHGNVGIQAWRVKTLESIAALNSPPSHLHPPPHLISQLSTQSCPNLDLWVELVFKFSWRRNSCWAPAPPRLSSSSPCADVQFWTSVWLNVNNVENFKNLKWNFCQTNPKTKWIILTVRPNDINFLPISRYCPKT